MRRKIRIRQARVDDIEAILLVEEKAWPENLRASREMYQSRLGTFPQGTLIAEREGNIEGVVVVQLMNFSSTPDISSWNEATDYGYIKNSHDPEGNSLYGVNLSVFPQTQSRVALALLEAVDKLAIRLDLKQILLGGRILSFARYLKQYCQKNGISVISDEERDKIAEDYMRATNKRGNPLDPEINFYQKAGTKIIKLLPNYFKDPESLDYGVLLVWLNPFCGKPFPRFWSWQFKLKVKSALSDRLMARFSPRKKRRNSGPALFPSQLYKNSSRCEEG